MLIIGITGTLGAGKGTIVDYLVEEKGFIHYSVRAFLLEKIREQNLPENRDSMVVVANKLRSENSPSYITDQLFLRAKSANANAVIESIRTPGEVMSLKEKGDFVLLAVDADPQKRFERVKARNTVTDQIDFKTFLENEKREMNSDDPNKQNLQACIAKADFTLTNNGSISDLLKKLKETLNFAD